MPSAKVQVTRFHDGSLTAAEREVAETPRNISLYGLLILVALSVSNLIAYRLWK